MNNKRIKKRNSKILDISYRPIKRFYPNGGLLDKWNNASGEALSNSFSSENLGNTLGSIGGSVTTILDSALKNSRIADTTEIENEIEDTRNTNFSEASSYDDLLNQWDNFSFMKNDLSYSDIRGVSTGEMIGNTISAVGSGATTGAQVGGPWGCVCAGTRVITTDGRFINIEDLSNDDGIVGYDSSSIRFNKIQLNTGEAYKECVKIYFNNGTTLECSTDHPIYSANSGRAKRKTISGLRYREKEFTYINASDIKVGYNVAEIDNVPIFGDIEEKDAYLIGMLIGDGTYGYKHGVQLFSGDSDTWNYIEKFYPSATYIVDNSNKYNNEFRRYYFKKFTSILNRLGIANQTKNNKRLPTNIHLWNKSSVALLLAGLYDTDGYITIEKNNKFRIAFCQSNEELIKEVREQLLKFGIHTYIKYNKSKSSIYKEHLIKSKECYVLIIKDILSAARFIDNIPLNISYKRMNLEKIRNIINSKKRRDNSYLQGIKAIKVTNIENIGVKRIYNLEALDSHNYIVNGIITHNSIAGAAIGLGSSLAGIFTGNAKAKDKLRTLKGQITDANNKALFNLDYQNQLIANKNKMNSYRTIAAEGGLLNKPQHTHGGDFLNGVTLVKEGGTHEVNPNQGVLMGVSKDGVPNLVEEGEVIFNDFVFSNRLAPSKKELELVKLPNRYNKKSFAKIAEDINKESVERPFDPISKRSLEDSLNKLAFLQESIKRNKEKNKYSLGGRLLVKGGPAGMNPALEDEYSYPISSNNGSKLISNPLVTEDNTSPINNTTDINETEEDLTKYPEYLRFLPVLGSAVGAVNSIFSKPDYSNSNILLDTAKSLPLGRTTFKPINDYLRYNPIDSNYYYNKLLEQSNTTKRALLNAGLNPSSTAASLLINDYNTRNSIGDTLLKTKMYNDQLRQNVAAFNRGTRQYNSQGLLQSSQANAQLLHDLNRLKSSLIGQGVQMREMEDSNYAQAKSMNLTNLFDNLGSIGRENVNWNFLDALIENGALAPGSENLRKSKGGLLTKRSKIRYGKK